MTVTFFGHSDTPQTEKLRQELKSTVEELAEAGATEFLLGGYGSFDELAAGVVREIKKDHPNVRVILVLPYLDRKVDTDGYDSTIYPPLESTPKRYAICHRNRWMVESADVVVCFVNHGWGGAASAMRHAVAKRKKSFHLAL